MQIDDRLLNLSAGMAATVGIKTGTRRIIDYLGRPGVSGGPVVTTLVCFLHIAREAAGALGTRHSPRPLFFKGACFMHSSGASRRGNADAHL